MHLKRLIILTCGNENIFALKNRNISQPILIFSIQDILKYACDELQYERWQNQRKSVRFSDQITVREPEERVVNVDDENAKAMGDATKVKEPTKDDGDDDVPSVITHDFLELNINANNSKDNEVEINEDHKGSQREVGGQEPSKVVNSPPESKAEINRDPEPIEIVMDMNVQVTNIEEDKIQNSGLNTLGNDGNVPNVSNDSDVIGIDNTDNTVLPCVSADISTPSAPPTSQNMEIANGVFDIETKHDAALTDNTKTGGMPEVSSTQAKLDSCENLPQINEQIPDAYASQGIESIQILQPESCVTEFSQTQSTTSYNWGSDQIYDPFAQVTMEQITDIGAVSNPDKPADAVGKTETTPNVFMGPNRDFGNNSITLFGAEQNNYAQTNTIPIVQSQSPDKIIMEAPITDNQNAVNFADVRVETLPNMNTVFQNNEFEQAVTPSFVESVGPKPSSSYNWGNQGFDPFSEIAAGFTM